MDDNGPVPRLPDGDPAPASGELPDAALATLADTRLGIYVHVPYCSVRCGYCDFNTYTLTELGPGASTATFADQALAELDLAGRRPRAAGPDRSTPSSSAGARRPSSRRPTSCGASTASGERFGLAPDAEVTTEANPDSVTAADLEELAAGGFTRVSVGMQSVVPHVLRTLERTHDPARVATAVAGREGRGLATSVDLIYGTPGESPADWRASLDAAVDLEPDHVSAYALVVEEGTRLAAQVRRGEVAMPEGDDEADKYELADEVLAAAGFDWYEVSNWSRDRGRAGAATTRGTGAATRGGASDPARTATWAACAGGTSSTRGPTPRAWATAPHRRRGGRRSPTSSATTRRCCCGVRLREGLPVDGAATTTAARPWRASSADGLVDGRAAVRDRRVVLTRRGRLLADTVVRRLLGV